MAFGTPLCRGTVQDHINTVAIASVEQFQDIRHDFPYDPLIELPVMGNV